MNDIKDLSFPELEGLMEALNKNAEREMEEIEHPKKKRGNGQDLLAFLEGTDKKEF